ncbi:MAG: restriction endonuclease subunit S [Thiothrix sp.]|uniref:restriction endonuclease subunit S n=1 Tax=Thiothrix sp. TaxID=1032 RepID=UPI00261C01B3|nr:restriction endonuclease subunit S [Thiothrix sp.]MDD5392543.1 restriction endonuclease subunit S [Thiothrix sp.]
MADIINLPALRFDSSFGWSKRRLGDVVDQMQSGVSRLLSDQDIGYPVLRSTNLIDGQLDFSDLKYWYKVDDKGVNLKNFILKDGDLLVNFINSLAQIGKVAEYRNILGRDFIYTTNIMRLTFKANVSLRYMYYLFHTSRYEKHIALITKPAVNQASFTTKDFKDFDFFIPSFKEQKKIADFLTAVDTKIQQLKRERELMQQYKKGVMQQLFSQQVRFQDDDGRDYPNWEEDEFGKFVTNKSSKYDPNKEIVDFICVELDSLGQETGVLRQTYSSREQASIKSKFKKGNVLFGKLRPYLKKYWMASFDGVCSTEIWVLDGKKIQNDFLFYLIQTHEFQEIANVSFGSKMPRSDWSFVSSHLMAYPCFEEQGKIAGFLVAIDAKIQQVSAQVAQAETFKKGLLQQMFV